MNHSDEQLDELAALVANGRLDELTPPQVDALEAHLNASPEAAARLADLMPGPAARLDAPVEPVSPETWNRVWDDIHAGTKASAARAAPGRARRWALLGRAVAAAAACVALVGLWYATSTPSERSWELHLSENVQIHDLEVYGEATSFVVLTGDGDGAAVMWVLDEEGT